MCEKANGKGEGKITNGRLPIQNGDSFLEERPYNKAFLENKLPSPHEGCLYKSFFYIQDGLAHHYRTIHKCPTAVSDIKMAKSILVEKYSMETLSCLKKLSTNNKSKVFAISKEI